MLWSVAAAAGQAIVGAWDGELLPTRARATAESAAALAGSFGGVVGLQTVRWLQPGWGLGSAVGLVSLPALAGAGLLLLLPETRGRPLPD